MAVDIDDRFDAPIDTAGTDLWSRSRIMAAISNVRTRAAMWATGAVTSRPAAAASQRGKIFVTTDGSVAICNNGVWLPLAPMVDFRNFVPAQTAIGGDINCSPALAEAMGVARSLGCPLWIPPGHYLLNAKLGGLDYHDSEIIGAGSQHVTFYSASNDAVFEGVYLRLSGMRLMVTSGHSNTSMVNVTGNGCKLRDIVAASGSNPAWTQAAIKLQSTTPGLHGPLGAPANWLLHDVAVVGGGGSWSPIGISVSGDDAVSLRDVAISGCQYGLAGSIGTTDIVKAENIQFSSNTLADIHWSTNTPLQISGGRSRLSEKFLVVDTASTAQVAVRDFLVRSADAPADNNLIKWDGPHGILNLEAVRFVPVGSIVPHIQLTSAMSGKTFALTTAGCSGVSNPTLAANNANGLLNVAAGTYTQRHKPWLQLDAITANVTAVHDV